MSAIDAAKATLLRALDQLERAEQDLDAEPDRVDLIVVYSIGRDNGDGWTEVRGWAGTAAPKWIHAAMLRRAADAFDAPQVAIDDDDEDEPE